jgi:hypothetical protein
MYGDISEALGGDFIPEEHEVATDFEPLPAGDYQVMIDSAEIKTTSKGDGKFLKLELTVLGDNFNGRKLFDNINLKNPNKQCEDIGKSMLASLAIACGITNLRESAELLGKQVIVKIKVTPATEKYDAGNQVRAYKPVGGVQPQYAPQQTTQSPQPKQQATERPINNLPWKQ